MSIFEVGEEKGGKADALQWHFRMRAGSKRDIKYDLVKEFQRMDVFGVMTDTKIFMIWKI